MKKITSLLAISVLLMSACSPKQEKTGEINGDRIEITPLIVNRVIFQDTFLINRSYADSSKGKTITPHSSYDPNPALYLKDQEFNKMKEAVLAALHSSDSKVFLSNNGGAPDWTKPASKQEIREKMIVCDSIKESSFDADGNEILTPKFYCDSTSIMDQISQIYFYETWYFNKKSNMIEREVRGYSVYWYDAERQAFRQLFYVFKDEESFKTVKKNYWEL